MMNSRSAEYADAGRGVVVAFALGVLVLGVFLLIAYGRHWRLPAAAAPKTSALPVQRPEGSSPKAAKDDDDSEPPGLPGASGLSAKGNSVRASNAADALRQILESYKADQRRTKTVSISSSGQVRVEKGEALTTLDGLPSRSFAHGTLLTGTNSSKAPAQ